MIESIEFTNYKALRKTTLPLAPFTLLLGPNGSGKTSVLEALKGISQIARRHHTSGESGLRRFQVAWNAEKSVEHPKSFVSIRLLKRWKARLVRMAFQWNAKEVEASFKFEDGTLVQNDDFALLQQWLADMETYALDPTVISQPVMINSGPLRLNGLGLAAVLDDLKDNKQDQWELLQKEMRRWLPEYDSIVFDKPEAGKKAIGLLTRKGGHRIPASALSQGTPVSLALLTLAYMPNPPTVIGLEEIDRGLHPRLLRHLQDALYRLSYPESCGEKRPAIQVIATTHSPYLLDLYRDHPEEVVLAEKEGLDVQFKRLTDIEHFEEILGDSPLSDVWYSGVLGGVSVLP
jgi:predicted ATPase